MKAKIKARFQRWFPWMLKAVIGFRVHIKKDWCVRIPLNGLTRWQRFRLWIAGFKVDAL